MKSLEIYIVKATLILTKFINQKMIIEKRDINPSKILKLNGNNNMPKSKKILNSKTFSETQNAWKLSCTGLIMLLKIRDKISSFKILLYLKFHKNTTLMKKFYQIMMILIKYYQTIGKCLDCHSNNGSEPTWTGYPTWPASVTYEAVGFGAYPFWTGPSDRSLGDGAPISVKWSNSLISESLAHSTCQLDSIDSSITENLPCTNLMVGEKAYLYNEDTKWCCLANYETPMTSTPYNFMNIMTYEGVAKDYSNRFYTGPVHNYTYMAIPTPPPSNSTDDIEKPPGRVIHFWYLTVADGSELENMPVE